MRTLFFCLASLLPLNGAVAARADVPPVVREANRPVYLVLVNMSVQRRQVRLKTGLVELPVGEWVTVELQAGETLHIVSDSNNRVDERIAVQPGDEARVLRIR